MHELDKYEIGQILREIGIMIELIDENPKKGLAYRKAAFSIESLSDLKKITQKKQLTKLPGIGNKIAHMIESLIKQGSLDYYEQLKIRVPSSLLEFVQIPGLSINWIRYFYEKFKITTINEFEELLKSGSLANIKGLNPWKIKKIFRGLSLFKKEGPSLLFPQAKKIALCICESLRNHVLKINITGALRRLCELIYEIDLICISEYPQECISFFKQNQLVKEVSKVTETTVSVILKNGLKANIFFVEPEEYFYELMILTGNRKHLKDLNSQAKTLGFSSFSSLKQKKCTKEEDIYHSLKLPYIYPEMREGLGEVEAANQGKLPSLIKLKDLKGTFHCHTIDSDGTNTLEDLSEGARKLGWEYLGISDHSKSSYQAHGMKEQQLLEQIEKICEINNKNGAAFQLFSGIECDVLKDGQLDLSDEVLKKLDFVIISIHRFFSMKKSEMTKRLIKGIENPYTTIVGHLTGRLLRHRDPYEINIPKILDACVANGKVIELNAYPSRLDMDWHWWIKAKEKGLKCSINPDAHHLKDLENCEYGINMARKGWLEKKDVINTMSLKEMRAFLKNR